MIRALIVLECVLLIIVALDRVIGVPTSGGAIARERGLGTNAQVASIRATTIAEVAARSELPLAVTLKETGQLVPITPMEPTVVSTAMSERPLPTASR